MKNIKVKNNHKNKDEKLKTILSIWYFKCKRLPDRRLMIHKDRIFAHVIMQKLGINYW